MPLDSDGALPVTAEGAASAAEQGIEKVGARNSRADFARIQSIHDNSVLLGAICDCIPAVEKRLRTLYVSRPLLNKSEFSAWAKSQGFATVQDKLHATIGYSKAPVEWPEPMRDTLVADDPDGRVVTALGDGGAVVLKFKSAAMNARWDELRAKGLSWEHFAYTPHVTISWQAGDVDLAKVAPFYGELVFGPERFAEVDDDWKATATEKMIARVAKVDDELGIVFGWAIISKINGEDYWDTQQDHIPEDSMLVASADYMMKSRIAGNMHRYEGDTAESVEPVGKVIFAFPLTTEIAKSMNIKSAISGLMIGMKVDRPDILAKFKSGEYTGFSIGGYRLVDEVVS